MRASTGRLGSFCDVSAVLLVLVLLAAGLTGCVGGDDVGPASRAGDRASGDVANPWQAGLADELPTPSVAEQRSREERRDDLAEPGDPTFVEFDAAFRAFMEAHDIPTGQVAVMHEGQLRYTRGYGHVDEQANQPADAETIFRIASITKPMTAAVVGMQVEQGLYNWSDPVFCVPPDPVPECLLPIEPHPAFPVEDDRLGDVTVRHLLGHTGGWGRTMDPIFVAPADIYDGDVDDTISIAEQMDIEPPPPTWRLAQYVMGQSIAEEPGEVSWYCNVCYVLAGLVSEAATGASLEALYDAYIFEPLEVEGDIELGRTLPEQRPARETFYPCEPFYDPDDKRARSVFAPGERTCWPDGGWSMRTLGAAGGLVATASAVAAIYDVYTEHVPTKVGLGPFAWEGHLGGLPATATMTGVLEDEDTVTGKVQYVALFNEVGIEEPYYPYANTYRFEQPLLALSAGWGASENAPPAAG